MIRAVDKWLAGYVASAWRRPRGSVQPRHLLFCIADHFEPFRGNAGREAALTLVRRWAEEWPRLARAFRDADGRAPVHTFFYPAEDYDPEVLDLLAGLCRRGLGEVEVHLHHRNDTAQGLRDKLVRFRDLLASRHGLLGRLPDGTPGYGFIHGNWALCNSRPDGDWCGVNEELGVLRETGCYADFTFPSAPSPTQPRTVNAIYRAVDRPGRPRGHDRGRPVRATPGATDSGPANEGLMIIEGPLALDWQRRKWGILPRLDNGEITGANPPTPARTDRWTAQGIHVRGKAEWVFVKVHTHGCVSANTDVLLGDVMRRAYEYLERAYNDGAAWRLHYVSAREMHNLARAAERGAGHDPGPHRDAVVRPPGREWPVAAISVAQAHESPCHGRLIDERPRAGASSAGI